MNKPFGMLVAALLLAVLGTRPGWCQAVNPAEAAHRWEPEIRSFTASDLTNPPPRHAVLFLGSSSIRLWPKIEQAFPGHTVFKRGFGGSELSDSVAYAGQIVLPYKPNLVLLYAGDNDLANGKSPERVLADFKAFVQRVQAALPETRIAYLAVKPSIARRRLLAQIRATNRLIKDYTESAPGLTFVDVFTPILGPSGEPQPELFAPDGLHLNPRGYALWASVITPVLDKYDAGGIKGR